MKRVTICINDCKDGGKAYWIAVVSDEPGHPSNYLRAIRRYVERKYKITTEPYTVDNGEGSTPDVILWPPKDYNDVMGEDLKEFGDGRGLLHDCLPNMMDYSQYKRWSE